MKTCPSPLVSVHEELPDVLVVKSHQLPNTVKPLYEEVIVGLQCAVAVLRGLLEKFEDLVGSKFLAWEY